MPFTTFLPYSFSLNSVQMNAPAASGVYGISNAREWILIGETDNIKATLLRHLTEMRTPLQDRVPTGFVFEICVAYNRTARQERLIQEYQPVCNRRPR